MEVQRGIVSTIEGSGGDMKARILPEQSSDIITAPLVVPSKLRNGSLAKGAKVIFVEFSDNTGAVLMRADGEEDG